MPIQSIGKIQNSKMALLFWNISDLTDFSLEGGGGIQDHLMFSHVVPMQGCLQTSCMLSHSDMLCRPSFGHTVKKRHVCLDGPEESAGPGLDWKTGERAGEIQHCLGGISAADPNFGCVQPTICINPRGEDFWRCCSEIRRTATPADCVNAIDSIESVLFLFQSGSSHAYSRSVSFVSHTMVAFHETV